MNPDAKIISLAANTPPASGDRFEHPTFRTVRLVRRAGGDSWHCLLEHEPPGHPLRILRPCTMRRLPS